MTNIPKSYADEKLKMQAITQRMNKQPSPAI